MKKLINHPQNPTPLGNLLNHDLKSGHWTEFRAAVAFARLSGVNRLSTSLNQFGKTGKINISIGVKDLPTTEEALKMLLSKVGALGQIWIFHQESGPTFHPKVYYFSNKSQAKIYVGSGNLTKGGLYENYEAFLCNTLDRSTDSHLIAEIESMLNSWATASSVCQQLSPALIASLLKGKYIVTEAQANKTSRTQNKKKGAPRHPIFGSQPTPKAPHLPATPVTLHPGNPAVTPTATYATSFWFQTGVMTSASRNQLDFSKHGRQGHPGGISLFGINPASTSISRIITIEYLGVDYQPNKIFYGTANGTWRIRFSGKDHANTHLAQISKSNFPHKILVFHKLSSSKYRLECLPLTQLPTIKASSRWTDKNPGTNGREYGVLQV